MRDRCKQTMMALAVIASVVGCDDASRSKPATPMSAASSRASERYAGSQSCRACHEQAYVQWKTSNHALAEREVDPKLDQGAFNSNTKIQHGSQVSSARESGGKYQLVTLGRDGAIKPHDAQRVLGNTPLRQFLIKAPGGRFQMTELAYDPHASEWFDVFGDEDRQPHEWGHWSNRGMTWNSMCADCHNTDLHKNYDAATDAYNTTRAEMGVGCEACHGPSAAHVEWQREHAGDAKQQGDDPALSKFSAVYKQQQLIDMCGSCHSRRSELKESYLPDEPYLDAFVPTLPDLDETWYADGQVHEEDYVYASFLMSRMYRQNVGCPDCHQPHGLALLQQGNDLCLRCHTGKIDPAAHSFHDINDAGGQCANCHMPRTTYMQRHARRDHGFTIPDPLLTREHGIPNACNRCHTDKEVDWAIDAVQEWYGNRMDRSTRQRARLIARARKAEPGIETELIDSLRAETNPTWRAILTGILRGWVELPEVSRTLIERLKDPSPLVRMNAARALGDAGPIAGQVLRETLKDPVRAVRVWAAWAAGPARAASPRAQRELMEYLEHNADQPAGVLSLAAVLREQGKSRKAVARLKQAIGWQPDLDALHYALGMSLASLGRSQEATIAFERACELAPTEPFLWYSLGLSRAEQRDLLGAAAALKQACTLDPSFARAWYNLGLTQNTLGMNDDAVRSLQAAAQIEPTNAQTWFALATVLRDADRLDEARAAAQMVLRIDPQHPQAAALLASLGGGP